MKTETIYYEHIPLGGGRATVAIRLVDESTVNVGLALCSPKDQFSRRRGRIIAGGRLNKGKLYLSTLEIDPDESIKVQVRDAVAKSAEDKDFDFPSWTRGGG